MVACLGTYLKSHSPEYKTGMTGLWQTTVCAVQVRGHIRIQPEHFDVWKFHVNSQQHLYGDIVQMGLVEAL